jgi:hypothetical protein
VAVFSLRVEKTGNTIRVYASNAHGGNEIVVLVRLQRHIQYLGGVGTYYIWPNKAIEPGLSTLVHTEDLGSYGAGQRKVWFTGEYYEVEETTESEQVTV